MRPDCPYKFDNVQCAQSFGHEGDHHAEVKFRTKTYPLDWAYDPDVRAVDVKHGYVPCQAQHPDSKDIRGTWDNNLRCWRPIDHEGDHEGDVWTGREKHGEPKTHIHWDESVWEEPEPEPAPPAPKASRPVPQGVLDERLRRSTMHTRVIAFQTKAGEVMRHEVVALELIEGSLVLHTQEEDLIYPAGSWGPVAMEPVEW